MRPLLLLCVLGVFAVDLFAAERLRVMVETDAGGDPDDEQSIVRFLLYASEWDIEGIINNREQARDGENKNPVRDGLGIVRRQLDAYGQVHAKLVKHDNRFPTRDALWKVTVAGYDRVDDGVKLVIAAVDKDDPRPLWFLNWGTDGGASESCLKRALDRVLKERGPEGYAKFKKKLRLSSDDQWKEHTWNIQPPFELWVYPFYPNMDGGRWYHRFSVITKFAGGFDLKRDVLENHGPLGATYPTNTHIPQKEGDSPTFMYLIPNGLNDPEHPEWGSWAGRFAKSVKGERIPQDAGERRYFSPNQRDTIDGKTNRDNTLARWAAHIQNDFAARMDWCVKDFAEANHAPVVKLAGEPRRKVRAGEKVDLDASASSDPDGQEMTFAWVAYSEVSGYRGRIPVIENGAKTMVTIPLDAAGQEMHVILMVSDRGTPVLTRYARVILDVAKE